jgi:conjugal transfer pilus assembly protein TraI
MAMRALADVGMLVPGSPGGPPTLSRDFNGTPTVGVVIDPRLISGFDLTGFSVQDPEGR